MRNKIYGLLDLFAGIGGFSRGLEEEGFETLAFCEWDGPARKVLKKHFKKPIFKDVSHLECEKTAEKVVFCDGEKSVSHKGDLVITGGFPCQDVSRGGKQKGVVDGARSSLFSEIVRLTNIAKPKFVLMENVEALLSNGMAVVVREFNKIGYDCEWSVHYAKDLGLPHVRARVYILCYPRGEDKEYLNKKIYDELNISSEIDQSIYKVKRVSPKGGENEERLRAQRVKQCGNSIVPAIAGLWGKLIRRGGDALDVSAYRKVCHVCMLDSPEKERLPRCGIAVKGTVYEREEITRQGRDNDGKYFPTPVASDSMLVLGKEDKYKLTKNGRVRVVRRSGSDASLNLARFVRFFPEGKLKTNELPSPVDELLDPELTERLMGYPKNWTKVSINKNKSSKKGGK